MGKLQRSFEGAWLQPCSPEKAGAFRPLTVPAHKRDCGPGPLCHIPEKAGAFRLLTMPAHKRDCGPGPLRRIPEKAGAFRPLAMPANKRGFSPGRSGHSRPGLKPHSSRSLVSELKPTAFSFPLRGKSTAFSSSHFGNPTAFSLPLRGNPTAFSSSHFGNPVAFSLPLCGNPTAFSAARCETNGGNT